MLPERIFAVRKVFYDVPAVRALLAEDRGCQIDEISDRDVLDAIASWAEDDLETESYQLLDAESNLLHDHASRCCSEHHHHTIPHVGCIMR